jgi:heme oxygenase
MNNLKELTQKQHKKAERSKFIVKLLKKEVTPHEYYIFMRNQHLMYSILELVSGPIGIFDGVEAIKRSDNIRKDIEELEKDYGFSFTEPYLKSTYKYVEHIIDISNDYNKLLAHVYVRHMGDLSGGQIIKRFVHGSGKHYNFDANLDELKEKFRNKLSDDLAEEAKICFSMVYDFMEELETSFGNMETPN